MQVVSRVRRALKPAPGLLKRRGKNSCLRGIALSAAMRHFDLPAGMKFAPLSTRIYIRRKLMKLAVRSAVIVFLVGVFSASLFAQRVEIYPNAGGIFPLWMKNTDNKFKADGIYGLKGVFLDENAQIEGSVGYINHFELKNPPNAFNPSLGIVQPTVFGLLYDVNGTYNFGKREFLNTRVSPFVTAGVGGLTAQIRHGSSTFVEGGGNVIGAAGALAPNPARSIVMNDGDTFFTFNYGVGVKALNVMGPVGLRVDVRGRTLPNFFGHSETWLEPTAGLVFSWGER
jgi:hypothetical protein